jgi:hypothetical protein
MLQSHLKRRGALQRIQTRKIESEAAPRLRRRVDPRRLGIAADAVELLMGAKDQLERTGKIKRCVKLLEGILFGGTYIRSDSEIASLRGELSDLGDPPNLSDLTDYIDSAIDYFQGDEEI